MSPRSIILAQTVLSFAALCTLAAGDTRDIILKSATCQVTIEPATLRTAMTSNGARSLLVSTGHSGLGPVDGLVESTNRAEWRLPQKSVALSASLDGGELTVEIRGSRPGSFTWPVLELSSPAEALIWPFWEGRFIPLDDPAWKTFLVSQEWDTLEGLCMPFWGVYAREASLTYIATNRFNNTIAFDAKASPLTMRFSHEFPPSERERVYGFVISLTESTSPVEPARVFRRWLERQKAFVPMREKLKTVPKAERLLGAPHFYLWGDSCLTRHDIKPAQWHGLCQTLVTQATASTPSVGKRVQMLMNPPGWKQVEAAAKTEWPDNYVKTEIAAELARVLERSDFYDQAAWQKVELSPEIRRLLDARHADAGTAETSRLNGLLLQAAFPDAFLPVEQWGDGVSLKMLRALKEAGLDRARLCVPGWEGVEKRPLVAKTADEMGYLFGTYDSFHSIHDPKLKGTDATWPTAQFDQELYENGPIVRQDGTKRAGFKKQGYLLSPAAARPWVERRVRQNMKNTPFSHYFIDCDAFGSVYDDYSPLHPCTQAQDAGARVDRMAWIANTFNVVIGSEGGSSYATPVVHLAEGVLTPVIGWGDPDMTDKASKFYLGQYYPPDGPRVFLQPVPLKDEYVRLHYDPRFRLPLNEIVFHDSMVSTHHWSAASLKFTNVRDTVALTEMLYQCPPLYHLNLDELKKQGPWIKRHHAFFSPIHRQVGFARMTDFAWLTPDRLVQRTVFDDRVEVVANFSPMQFAKEGMTIPPGRVVARWLSDGRTATFTPGAP